MVAGFIQIRIRRVRRYTDGIIRIINWRERWSNLFHSIRREREKKKERKAWQSPSHWLFILSPRSNRAKDPRDGCRWEKLQRAINLESISNLTNVYDAKRNLRIIYARSRCLQIIRALYWFANRFVGSLYWKMWEIVLETLVTRMRTRRLELPTSKVSSSANPLITR